MRPVTGKGPWDGMGAVMKQTVSRDITNDKILTTSGKIDCPREVAEHLKKRFETDEWQAEHADKKIHEVVVHYSHHDEISERPLREPEYEPLTGKMDSFSFLMLARDQVARRRRSHWCDACFRVRGRPSLQVEGTELQCGDCTAPTALPWKEMTVKNLGPGLAARRIEAQGAGHVLAQRLKLGAFFAVQAREAWSLAEDALYRPGHFWIAQASDVVKPRRVTARRETVAGQPFNAGDYVITIGRYFDRVAADASGRTFEEWQPELAFTPDDVGSKLTISPGGHVKVGSAMREVFWGHVQAGAVAGVRILSVNDEWVKYGTGRCDKFPNVRTAGGFIINSTELRSVNFIMEPKDKPLVRPRRSGVRAAVVSTPVPKVFELPVEIEDEIRASCW